MRLSLAGGYLIIDELDRAMSEATDALAVAERSADAWLTAEIIGVIVQVHAGRGELHPQVELLRRAIELYREAGDEASAGAKLTALGDLHTKRGSPAKAADAFVRGIALLRRADAAVPLARGLRRLAQAHADAEEFDQAIPLLEECLRLVRQAGEPVGELCVSTELAICHCELGDPALARQHAHTARQLAEQIDMPLYSSYAALAHALYLAGTGREDLALRTLREAVGGLGAMKLWQLTCLLHIGRWQINQGESAEGRATIQDGHSEAQRIGAVALARRFAAEQAP
jgi:tetratricopeptide (TPR) repeat protein